LRLLFTLFIHTPTIHVFGGACNFQHNLLLLTFLEYGLWNNGLRIGGSIAFPLSVDEPTKLFLDPKKLVAKNGLAK